MRGEISDFQFPVVVACIFFPPLFITEIDLDIVPHSFDLVGSVPGADTSGEDRFSTGKNLQDMVVIDSPRATRILDENQNGTVRHPVALFDTQKRHVETFDHPAIEQQSCPEIVPVSQDFHDPADGSGTLFHLPFG